MGRGVVVLMTDHGSGEGSRVPLEKAVELLTGAPPLSIDARHFMTGGQGRVSSGRNELRLEVPSEGFVVSPEVLIIYEIPPVERRRLVAFQRQLSPQRPLTFSVDPDAWRNATDKRRTVECFHRDGITHMETIALCDPDLGTALDAFERLGRDVWARPSESTTWWPTGERSLCPLSPIDSFCRGRGSKMWRPIQSQIPPWSSTVAPMELSERGCNFRTERAAVIMSSSGGWLRFYGELDQCRARRTSTN